MSPKLFNILLIISSIVIYSYVIKPLYTGEDTGFWTPKESVQSLLLSKKQYVATINGIDEIKQEAKKIEKEYSVFDDTVKNNMIIMVPDSINEVKLLSELTKIANDVGFAIEGLSVKDKSGEFSINFVIKTTYPKFKDFIARYEKSKRLLTLDSVAFTPVEDEQEPIKFQITMTTYYMNKNKK